MPSRLLFSGPVLTEPVVHGDLSGFFLATYRRGRCTKLGVVDDFVQYNHSRSRCGIVHRARIACLRARKGAVKRQLGERWMADSAA